jgi:Holliday junction resolvasome RuvABC DNA-binding subunit
MANRNVKSVRQVTNRKIARNRRKNEAGSNKIWRLWKRSQIKLYGFKTYAAMRWFKTPHNQRKEMAFQLHNS